MTMDTTTLFERIAATYPNAEPQWTGQPYYHGFVLEWGDGFIVATTEDCVILGVYTAEAWTDGDGPWVAAITDDGLTADQAVELTDYLTEQTPEGVDWVAWAQQRLLDGITLSDGTEVTGDPIDA